MSAMEFNVGVIQGENYRFAARTSWPSTKLTIDPKSLVLTTGFESIEFEKALITRLSDYEGFCWLFARGIRAEHSEEKNPPFSVFWAFDLTPIKRCLAENGFAFTERAD
jgi:hypothetical protein